MRTKSYLLLAVFVILSAIGCKSQELVEISVMSYNIRLSSGKDGCNSWENRKAATLLMLDELQPDLFGLQEAKKDQMDYLIANCPEYGYYGVGREDGVDKGEHMSIFYKKDKFELLDAFTYWLSETPEVPSMGWDAACMRTASVTLLKHRESGKKLYYVNTHLDHKGLLAQKNGLRLIVNNIKEMNDEGLPLLLTGDFNMIPSNPSIMMLDSMMNSARTFAKEKDMKGSFNGWKRPLADAALGDNLKEMDQEKLMIDYIYYSDEGVADCLSFTTVDWQFGDIPFISDHYPVIARLILE